jgi:hypothetical protein
MAQYFMYFKLYYTALIQSHVYELSLLKRRTNNWLFACFCACWMVDGVDGLRQREGLELYSFCGISRIALLAWAVHTEE